MTIQIVLVLFGVANSWSASPDPLDSLCLKEEGLIYVSGSGKVTLPGPTKGTDVISKLAFVLSKEGEYHISETMGVVTSDYWKNGYACYEQTGNKTDIYAPDEGAWRSMFIRQMLFPGLTVLSPLLEGVGSKELISRESAQDGNTGKFSYRYADEDSGAVQCEVTLKFGEGMVLERIRVTDSTSSSMAILYEYSDYVDVDDGRKLPKYFRFSLQRGGSDAIQMIAEVRLDSVEIPSASPDFSPDLEQLGNVTDYRKGIPWLKKESSKLLEQLLDSVHF